MASPIRKKRKLNEEEDIISSLPNELIHHILSFLDTQLAVQTSVLSRRWKFIWTTLPFVNFDEINRFFPEKVFAKLINHVFSRRNPNANVFKMKLHVRTGFPAEDLRDHVNYAISHGVRDLDVESFNCDLTIFKSKSLKQFKLGMNFEHVGGSIMLEDCWDLPNLKTLYLVHDCNDQLGPENIPEPPYLTCLAALKTLHLDGFGLPNFFSFPALSNLYLKNCKFPGTIWDLPSLITLKLEEVDIPLDISDFFSVLVSLQNLTMLCCFDPIKDCFISCPELLYLNLKTMTSATSTLSPNIVILAPKLRGITTVGIFTITRGVFKLENADVKLHGCFEDKFAVPWGMLKQYYCRLTLMFAGMGSTKILTLDSDTIEALSVVHDLLEGSSSPFNNLKYVKLPNGYNQSSLSDTIKSYLLGASPGATIVTKFPQNNVIPQIASVSQNVVLEESLETPTMELVGSQGLHKKVCTDPSEKRVQDEHQVQNVGLVDGKVIQVGPLKQGIDGLLSIAPGEGNDWKITFRGNSDFGLWQGYEVNSEFVGLLDLILEKYPETFEHFNTTNKKICTIKLNLLCTLVNAFMATSMTDIDNEMLTEFRTLFADLQKSFNLEWLVSRLNNFEQSQCSQHENQAFSSCIKYDRNKFQVLPTVGTHKMTKMQEAIETKGTNHAATEAFGSMGTNHAATEASETMGIHHAAMEDFGTTGTKGAVKAGYIGDDQSSRP